MNIFILDSDLEKSAQYHVDRHIIKMPLESAQILCTVHHISGSSFLLQVPYKPTHIKHKCVKWANRSLDNYLWLCHFGYELCREYSFRYNKTHKCEEVITWCECHHPNIRSIGLTPFAQAIPDNLRSQDAVHAYRQYYLNKKKHLFAWKNREVPLWIRNIET